MNGREGRENEVERSAGGSERLASEGASVGRHEQELAVGKETRERGAIRARKIVGTEEAREVVPRSVEHFDEAERAAPNEDDSGDVEVLPDGSVSIPILEEELVIEKRMVVRERVIIRKRTETRHEHVEAMLRKERVAVEADNSVGPFDEAG